VGQIIGELRQLLHAIVQPIEHDVDALGEVAQLRRQPLGGQAMVQIVGRNFRGYTQEAVQRLESLPDRPPGEEQDQ